MVDHIEQIGNSEQYYQKGNLFPLVCHVGSIYLVPETQLDNCPYGERVRRRGQYYTYVQREGCPEAEPDIYLIKRFITKRFFLALREAGYSVEKRITDYGNYYSVAYHPRNVINSVHRDILMLYDGFSARFPTFGETIMLRIDPHVVFKVVASIQSLITRGLHRARFEGIPVRYRETAEGRGVEGLLRAIDDDGNCRVLDFQAGREIVIGAGNVFPEARAEMIRQMLRAMGSRYDVVREIQRASFLHVDNPSQHRWAKTVEIVEALGQSVFPMEFGEFHVDLDPMPAVVVERLPYEEEFGAIPF